MDAASLWSAQRVRVLMSIRESFLDISAFFIRGLMIVGFVV